MDVFFLGGVCVGLAIYILYLQRKVDSAEDMMTNMIESMILIADGEAKAVRTDDGVRVVPITPVKEEKLLS
jgi:hypothetical protein